MNSWFLSVATLGFSIWMAVLVNRHPIQFSGSRFEKGKPGWSFKEQERRCHSTCRLQEKSVCLSSTTLIHVTGLVCQSTVSFPSTDRLESFLDAALSAHYNTVFRTSAGLNFNLNIQNLFDSTILRLKQFKKVCNTHFRLLIVETIPDNVTFGTTKLPESTFEAWKKLIENARHKISIAAYKSSLTVRGVWISHWQEALVSTFLLITDFSSYKGRQIYDLLVEAKKKRGIEIRMVENYPSKDVGDNEDGIILEKHDVIERRTVNLAKIYGSGKMHSKFIVVDEVSFYVGSANLDWRSLNQKMEIGFLATGCPHLAKQLTIVFDSYWHLAAQALTNDPQFGVKTSAAKNDEGLPVSVGTGWANRLRFCDDGVESEVFIATSPKQLITPGGIWDLDAIISVINRAEKFIYIHVMDYIPMVMYSNPPYYWSKIDDALRAAVRRNVEVKILSAALHFVSKNLHFLHSLEIMNRSSVMVVSKTILSQ
ncbi:unnamed protein product [Soboliphyme baturini]|uniref:PLD phosphodiesterase domain-containing protein n=1 Tax=Soboliphyme baturini TaxID=241478 RepID=A0A183J254_9BILA|nr:unnamed protein product [Soboliphyme baturini]